MQNYKPNSHRFKEEQKTASAEEKRVNHVVNGAAKTKPNKARKLAGIFISDDISNVKSYILNDVLLPSLKKAVLGAIDMSLPGGSVGYNKRSSESKVSYRKYYDEPGDRQRASSVQRDRFDHDDIIFETRGDAELALDEMHDILERYKIVRVADLYDIAQLSQPYTSNRYGWTNLRSAEIIRAGGGYIIRLPRALPID